MSTDIDWQSAWDEVLADTLRRHPEFGEDAYRASGRASRAWPEKETPGWWAEHGPQFVRAWELWRSQSGLRIADLPGAEGEAVPGIELEVMAERDDLLVKSIIDRVMVERETGQLYIVDIKSGSYEDKWPIQMLLNNLGLISTFGEGFRATWAGFWHARKGGVTQWFDLSRYDDEWVWDIVAKMRTYRDLGLFVPNPGNLCSACGVKEFCKAMGGDPSLLDRMQH